MVSVILLKNTFYNEVLRLALSSLKTFVLYNKKPVIKNNIVICDEEHFEGFVLDTEMLHKGKGVFVSLYKDKNLRGSASILNSYNLTVAEEVIKASIASSCQDPDFDSVVEKELDDMKVCVDIVKEIYPYTSEMNCTTKPLDILGVRVTSGYRCGMTISDITGTETLSCLIQKAYKRGDISSGENPLIEVIKLERITGQFLQ